VPAWVWKAAFEPLVTEDLRAGLPTIDAPTLLLWGDQDSVTFADDQQALLSAIPNARLVTYGGAGHALHWEEPARVTQDIVAFIAAEVTKSRI
jgi:non-heme chloroperoxidase